jgi:hypothetical protein
MTGLVAIVGIFALAVSEYNKASDVATAVGSVSGVIAALVGAYFGIRGTTVAQAQAMEMMASHLTARPQATSAKASPARVVPAAGRATPAEPSEPAPGREDPPDQGDAGAG